MLFKLWDKYVLYINFKKMISDGFIKKEPHISGGLGDYMLSLYVKQFCLLHKFEIEFHGMSTTNSCVSIVDYYF